MKRNDVNETVNCLSEAGLISGAIDMEAVVAANILIFGGVGVVGYFVAK
jgi:hypothetical protein